MPTLHHCTSEPLSPRALHSSTCAHSSASELFATVLDELCVLRKRKYRPFVTMTNEPTTGTSTAPLHDDRQPKRRPVSQTPQCGSNEAHRIGEQLWMR
jgi:hypothetical protein